MAQPKSNFFKEKEVELARQLRALAHPARLAILKTLSKRNECICGEIVEVLPLAQATVSQHLKELKSVGLIKGKVDGAKSCYCVNWKALERLDALFGEFTTELTINRRRCC